MRIILSPAKKMAYDPDAPNPRQLPQFLEKTQRLLDRLRGMSPEALQALWQCNDRIAAQNVERLSRMDLRRALTPAVLAYDGIAYQRMAPQVFTGEEERYVEAHLRILSGFYGILRPMDGVTPYRLEMQARLDVDGAGDLYGFWGDALARSLSRETDTVLNLASKEYARAVLPHLPGGVRVVTCAFCETKGARIVEKATLCKMARGEMVRFMAENRVARPENVRAFDRYGFRFERERSDENTYVFIREGGKPHA